MRSAKGACGAASNQAGQKYLIVPSFRLIREGEYKRPRGRSQKSSEIEIGTGHEMCIYPVYYQQDVTLARRPVALAAKLFVFSKIACPVLKGAYVARGTGTGKTGHPASHLTEIVDTKGYFAIAAEFILEGGE